MKSIGKLNKLVISLVLVLSLGFVTTSCSFLHEVFDGTVVTTEDNVKPEFKDTMVVAPLDGLTQAQKDKLIEAGKVPVIVDKGAVIDPTQSIEVTTPSESTIGNIVNVGLSLASKLFPQLAILQALALLVSSRVRQHYSAALKAVLPTDGSVDLGEAVLSIGRAFGLAHSSETTKEVFATEQEGSKDPLIVVSDGKPV